tara:strand:+ start:486 stop:2348 length:1863 start_codon:yes stop_codon:yes gene_type:complete
MIKTISQPTQKNIYGDYSGLEKALFFISILGSMFSAFTEFYGFKSDGMAEMFPILYPTLGILLIESSRLIIPLLFLTIFRLIRNFSEWKKRLPALVLLLIVSVILIFLSIRKSEDGINNRTIEKNEFKDSINVDDSKYNLLVESCNNAYQAEINSIENEVKSEYKKDLKKEQKKATLANERISQIGHIKAKWAVNTVAKKSNILFATNNIISKMQEDIKENIRTKRDVALSNLNRCKKGATDTLLLYANIAEHSFNKAKTENDASVERKILVNNGIMYVGIFFIILYSFVKEWLNHVSEREISYEFDETDNDFGFFQKLRTIGKSRLQNVGDSILTSLSQTGTQKQQEIERKKMEAEKETLHQNNQMTQQKAEFETLKAAIELQRVQNEAEAQRIKDESERAKIQASSERAKLRASTLSEEKRLKEVASENLRIEKERIQKSENDRLLQREKERLAAEQQENDRLEQQEERRMQQIATRKAIADKAEKIAANKLENDRLEQQEKERLQQANATIKNKNATGSKEDSVEATTIVDGMFNNHIENGKLSINKFFNTAVKNYYKRWIAATGKLNGDLSEGRREQVLRGQEDNKEKFLYAVDKAEELGVSISVLNDKVKIEYSK